LFEFSSLAQRSKGFGEMTHSIRKWNVSQPNIRKEYTKEAEEEKEEEGRIQEQSRYLISMNSNC